MAGSVDNAPIMYRMYYISGQGEMGLTRLTQAGHRCLSRGENTMSEKLKKAEMLLGYRFYDRPDMPTKGVLRLDTENEQHFLIVTKRSLQQLSKACMKHAAQLQNIQ